MNMLMFLVEFGPHLSSFHRSSIQVLKTPSDPLVLTGTACVRGDRDIINMHLSLSFITVLLVSSIYDK